MVREYCIILDKILSYSSFGRTFNLTTLWNTVNNSAFQPHHHHELFDIFAVNSLTLTPKCKNIFKSSNATYAALLVLNSLGYENFVPCLWQFTGRLYSPFEAACRSIKSTCHRASKSVENIGRVSPPFFDNGFIWHTENRPTNIFFEILSLFQMWWTIFL